MTASAIALIEVILLSEVCRAGRGFGRPAKTKRPVETTSIARRGCGVRRFSKELVLADRKITGEDALRFAPSSNLALLGSFLE
jgi:hypothetical protein